MFQSILLKQAYYPNYEKNDFERNDILIVDGKINSIKSSINCPDAKIIDVHDKILSPGFIDIHMHEENFANEGNEYTISKLLLKMGVTTCLGGNCGIQFQNLEDFRKIINDNNGCPINYLMLVGYNTLRRQYQKNRYGSINSKQYREILEDLKKQLSYGAFGVSYGLEYDPGISKEEIIAILNDLDCEQFVSIHFREDGDKAIDSVKEMIEIGRKTGSKIQLSHLSSCAALGQMEEVLKIINEEIDTNSKFNYDTYPYNACSTAVGSAVFDDGCFEKWGVSYDSIMLLDKPYENVRCTKEIFEEVRKKYPDMNAVLFIMQENEIRDAIANKYGMIGSDAIIANRKGHPRASGTFPRVIRKYVREEKALSLLDALKKMTESPAKRLGLKFKGEIIEGYDADIVIFDYATIAETSTFTNLLSSPKGIELVLIDGKIVLENSKIISENAGKFISNK